jgi:diguanylate cyclase (GGDEF)-like protein
LGGVGWAIALPIIGSELFVLPWLAIRHKLDFNGLLVASYVGVASVALLDWLSVGTTVSPASRPIYDGLYLLWLGSGVGVHPPRRAAPLLLAVVLAASLPLVYNGWTSDLAETITSEVLLWWALGVVIMMLMSYVRSQRVTLRAGEARAQNVARADALTGLSNRRAFDEALEAETARTQRATSALTVAMIDLDNLKAINDRFGHPEGDRRLRELADALRSGLRAGDRAFRWGGDEFAVIMPDTVAEVARPALERVAERLTGTSRPGQPATAFSFGLAETTRDTDPRTLVALADEELRAHKERGGGSGSW